MRNRVPSKWISGEMRKLALIWILRLKNGGSWFFFPVCFAPSLPLLPLSPCPLLEHLRALSLPLLRPLHAVVNPKWSPQFLDQKIVGVCSSFFSATRCPTSQLFLDALQTLPRPTRCVDVVPFLFCVAGCRCKNSDVKK